MDCDVPIVVHYTRFWLPESTELNINSANIHKHEIILEPQILWLSLIRKISGLKLVLTPKFIIKHTNDSQPSALVYDENARKAKVLRNGNLMDYILRKAHGCLENKGLQMPNTLDFFGSSKMTDESQLVGEAILSSLHIFKNLRVIVLFLIWVYEPILENVAKPIAFATFPFMWKCYSFYTLQAGHLELCKSHGYTSYSFVMRELKSILIELQHILSTKIPSDPEIKWFEGTVISSLAVLFSIPCKGL
ncbi:uncharacterized protein BdWA1_003913 [Babesia duncani]|uniref:Uncharacterized protein n=1 Tax=Babesia duncani TaxID=323732 RepID=A0AAD9PH12_9APIC|nr:hypothetical protein BdWA1_003913 [Babesia duncani]